MRAPEPIRTVEGADKLGEDHLAASVDASGTQLTRIPEKVVRPAPGLRRLSIRHRTSTTLETRSLELLRELERLEQLSLSGDAFLYDEQFAELGRLSQLTSRSRRAVISSRAC